MGEGTEAQRSDHLLSILLILFNPPGRLTFQSLQVGSDPFALSSVTLAADL